MFRFPSRIKELGTFRIVGHLLGRPQSHAVFAVRARRLRKGRVLLRGGTADACVSLQQQTAYLATGKSIAAAAPAQVHVKSAHKTSRSALPPTIGNPTQPSNPIVRAVSLSDAPSSIRPLLLTLLALSIALLAAAAMPQRVVPAGRTAGFVAERRAYLAAAGIWLLAIVAAVTAFS